MQTAALIIVCFFVAWLFAYLDSRVKFSQFIIDIPSVIGWMIAAGFVLFMIYSFLKMLFESAK